MSSVSFSTLNEKTNAIPLKRELLAWCPTMDLIACVADSDEVTVNRLSGQRVWSVSVAIQGSSQASPTSLAWRPDGKALAVGLSDGNLQYLDVNDGKTIQFLSGTQDSGLSISILRWMEGSPGKSSIRKADLSFDIRSQLPLLGPLPTSSIERIYTTKQAVQTLIHDLERETDRLKFLAVGANSSAFRLLIGSFHLDLLQGAEPTEATDLAGYNASADLVFHAAMTTSRHGLSLQIYEMVMFRDVDIVTKELTNTFNDYHAVSLYLKESLDYLQEEYTLLDETRATDIDKLQQLGDPSRETNKELFVFLLTGRPSQPVKEWLETYLNERSIKRWEKNCASSMDNIRKTIFESCLPACERLIIMAVKLRGLSFKAKGTASSTGIDVKEVNVVIKCLSLLIAQLHALVNAANSESELFMAFCQWIQFAMARQAPDDEHPDAIMPVETGKVVDYLKTQYPSGVVSRFFGDKEVVMDSFLQLEKDINTLDPFPKLDGLGCPRLKQTKSVLDVAANRLFTRPASLLVRNWRKVSANQLTSSTSAIFDSRFMNVQAQIFLYVATAELVDEMNSTLHLMRKLQAPNEGEFEVCRIKLDVPDLKQYTIQDLKFIDDNELLISLQSTAIDKTSHLVAIEYQAQQYTSTDRATMDSTPLCATAQDPVTAGPSKHRILPHGVHPVALSVNGLPGRRTGLYLLADRQRYTIFDLDNEASDSDASDDTGSAIEEEQGEED